MELLDQWRLIYSEVVQFSETIAQLPEGCECGNGADHLEGRCPCCDSAHAQGREETETCSEILSRLRADLSMLCEDFHHLAPPLEEDDRRGARLELRRGVYLAASDLGQVLLALEHVSGAVVGFRRTCAISDMHRVKRHTAAFRSHCDRLSADLLRE